MTLSTLTVNGRNVSVLRGGKGAPLLYLHGFADVHGAAADFLPFHQRLCEQAHVIAPAHPGCADSDELPELHSIEDVVFHYLEVIDALGLERFDLVGHCVGGWIAAELAVRFPEKVKRLALIGATGLFVPGHLIGDVFINAQAERGVDYTSLRQLLFARADDPVANRYFPNGLADIETEMRRYQMLRFGSFVGFKPPYFYNRLLRDRLYRAAMPALVIWGEKDRMVPRAHGETYAERLPGAKGLTLVDDVGHSAPLEAPRATAELLSNFLS